MSGIVTFTKAQRKGSHVLIALYGESSCGKTYSAILLARGLVGEQGRIAMLDTETGRGLMYDSLAGGYDYAELTPPFTPDRYIQSVKAAEEAGFDALIIDSASHEWEGLGGVLEEADAGKNAKGEALQGLVKWAKPKARHKKFVQALLSTRMHLIICLRAKEKMVQKKNDRGKEEIVSAGYVSVQDKRFIYEMTVQVFMPNDAKARGVPVLEKCPEDLLGAFPAGRKISVETGRKIAEWVSGGAPVDHAYEDLKREAEEAAEGGSIVLARYWKRLTDDQREIIKPIGANLRSIANAADEEIEREQAKPAPTKFSPAEAPIDPQAPPPADDPLAEMFDGQAAE